MAEAANRSPFKLPRGVRRATLKPQPKGQAGKGKDLKSAMQFAPEADEAEADRDFDAILQDVLKHDKGATQSQLSTKDHQDAAELAKRLADRVLKARGAQTTPDDDDLAEPADMQQLIEAREAMAEAAPKRPQATKPAPEPAPAPAAELKAPEVKEEPEAKAPEAKAPEAAPAPSEPGAEPADLAAEEDEAQLSPFAKALADVQAATAEADADDLWAEDDEEGALDVAPAEEPVPAKAKAKRKTKADKPQEKPEKPKRRLWGKAKLAEPAAPEPAPETLAGAEPAEPEASSAPAAELDDQDPFLKRLLADIPLESDAEDDDPAEVTDPPLTAFGSGDGTGMSFSAPPRLVSAKPVENPRFQKITEFLTPLAMWLSMAMVIASLVYGAWAGGVDVVVASLFGGGLLTFGSILILAGAAKAYSPILLTSFLWKRLRKNKANAAVLAGSEILNTLGLAEAIIDADADARLVTTRDGVVVYANDAYLKVAEEAGIKGSTGLPPRIDRLFGQSGTESSKMFRLAKACRSGTTAEEVLTQTMGAASQAAQGELPLRRFNVFVRPMRPAGDGEIYSAWRLHEMPVDRQQDSLKSAYFNLPRAVVALERSGAVAWMNLKAAELFGTKPGHTLALSDVIMGEVKPVITHLWEPEAEEYEARIRDRSSDRPGTSREVILTPFTKGGPGEGFVCVEVVEKGAQTADVTGMQAGADLTEAPFGVAVLEGDPSTDGKITYANNLFSSYFPEASEGARFSSVLSATAINELAAAMRARQSQKPLTKPIEIRVGEGAQAHIFRVYARPVRRRRGAYGPRQTVLYAVDITYQRRMEEDSVQGQKLQQIGQIAGSVAHDFNNLLVVVMGSTELLMRNHPVGDPSYRDLAMIYETAQRAQNLTRNLLAFSRKQTLKPEVCSMTELLNDFTPALKRYVSEKVSLEVVHGRSIPQVKADKGQIHLAVMNLAVNARDAMPGGGSLRIETKHVTADEIADYGYEVLEEVDHVLIEVADTGGGVPAEHADHIFEPFYTTKGEGQGTGLGLSTVSGAIAQMGGRIFLYNRAGEGATFRIFLPAVSAEEAEAAAERNAANVVKNDEAADPTGKGRILVVEDEDGVRSIVVRALSMCGYEIVEASDGDEALEILEEDAEKFDLVLTDIMMPEMDGPTLIEEAGEKLRGAQVVFMSGYAEAAMRDKLNTIEGARYLQKPFTLTTVAAVVKEALAR
ncbi:MAG: ATP-binding protein [Pseudomonadota bacterium]